MSPRFPTTPGTIINREAPYTCAPRPRVEVVYYMGKNSGFATKESPFAHVRLWSELEDLPLSMGTGLNRVSADELGKYLGKFFGWPVVTLEQVINVERTVMYRPTTPTETEGTDDVPH